MTHVNYTSDVKLFFAWAGKPPASITLHDVDAYVAHVSGLGRAPATVHRRLAALRAFYRCLSIDSDDAPPNPVLHRRHAIRNGRHLPHDASDANLDRLFVAILLHSILRNQQDCDKLVPNIKAMRARGL